jgi:hypothetical protein
MIVMREGNRGQKERFQMFRRTEIGERPVCPRFSCPRFSQELATEERSASVNPAPLVRVRLSFANPLPFSQHRVFVVLAVPSRLVDSFFLSVGVTNHSAVLCGHKLLLFLLPLDVDVTVVHPSELDTRGHV